jgi:phosphoinositide-3-kinase, regulatory subunit 4
VLITTWNWAYLTDFACFKPTYLPEDNPADFSFFFDTSLRRVCYVAPERFLTAGEEKSGGVTDVMDIFSLGCVIAELFLEGTPLFALSQMFKYRKGEYDPIRSYVDKIEDEEIKVDVL